MAGPLGRKLRFSGPPKSPLLVFDAAGSAILGRTALAGLAHAVLPARGEAFYLTPRVLWRMLKHAGRFDWRRVLRSGGRGILGELYKVHLLACVDAVEPKVVVTWIDNSWLFHKISRSYPKADFYAVQNGGRSIGCVTTNPPLRDPGGYVISMPDFLCFGDYEAALYRSHHHQVDRFHPVGPLIGGYYRSLKPLPQGPPEFDLCLVSQWRGYFMEGDAYPEVKKTIATLGEHLSRYLEERDVKLCVATRSSDPAERAYYEKLYGSRVTIVTPDDEVLPLSTYEAMDKSAVVVCFCSTVALEAFGWGHKVLFCNLFKHAESYSPREGPWSIEEPSYEGFREKLDGLRAMSAERYRAAAGEFARHAVRYDRPAHLYLRDLIVRRLAR